MPHLDGNFGGTKGFQPRVAHSYDIAKEKQPIEYEEIDCIINEDYTVKGRKEGSEVYMPFSFIQKYFEVCTRLPVEIKYMYSNWVKKKLCKTLTLIFTYGLKYCSRFFFEYFGDFSKVLNK